MVPAAGQRRAHAGRRQGHGGVLRWDPVRAFRGGRKGCHFIGEGGGTNECQLAFFNARFHKFDILKTRFGIGIFEIYLLFGNFFFFTKILIYCLALGI